MIAYTEKLGFDVLTTPIAEVDRRTLSQAWFSALHLGAMKSPAAVAPVSKRPARETDVAATQRGRKNTSLNFIQSANHRTRSQVPSSRHIGANVTSIERRAPTSVLARRIERAMVDRRMHHGTFVLDGMEGRVHVSVRSQSGRIHIVAVCAPRAKAYVAQALQHVRFSLARQGIAFDGSLKEA